MFGVPLPERILPSVSRTRSVPALARPGLRRVGMKKVFVPGMRALACPKASDRRNRWVRGLAPATSRLSVWAPRRLFALLTRPPAPQREQRFCDDRRVLFASGEFVDRSPGCEGPLKPLHCADLSEKPGAPVTRRGRENRPRQLVVTRLVPVSPLADLHLPCRGVAAERGGRLRRKLAHPVAVERAQPRRAHAMQREKRETRDRQGFFPGLGPRRVVGPPPPARSDPARQPVPPRPH